MKSLRWTLAFLRDPISALGSSIATIREGLAPLGSKALGSSIATIREHLAPLGSEAFGSSIATIREGLAPLGSEMQTRFAEALSNAGRKLALAVGVAALALVGAGYVLIGLWLGFNRLLGPIGASFLLGAFFLLASLVPLAVLYRTSRKPQVASDETRYDVSAGPLK